MEAYSYGNDDHDNDPHQLSLPMAAGGPGLPSAAAAASQSVVTAEERQLQLDFHALLADYIVGRRRVEGHPDAEQRCVCGGIEGVVWDEWDGWCWGFGGGVGRSIERARVCVRGKRTRTVPSLLLTTPHAYDACKQVLG